MADNSMPKVTITLGHKRQVVKKGDTGLDSSFGDSESIVGRKRSVKDRLGGNNDLTPHKRLRASGSTSSLSASNDVDDIGLSQDDLRFKIMQKTIRKKSKSISQQSGLDLRDMLSRPAQSSTTVTGPRKHMTERKDCRQHLAEPRNDRQCRSEELRDPRQRVAEGRDSRQHTPDVKDVRQDFMEPRDGRQRTSELSDPRLRVAEGRHSRQHMPEGEDDRQDFVEPRDGKHPMSELRDPRLRVAEVHHSRQHMSEGKDARQDFVEPRDGRQRMSELRDPRLHVAEVRDTRQHMAEGKDAIHHFVEQRDGRQSIPELRDPRLRVAEVRDGRHMGEIRDSRQHMPEGKNATQHFAESKDGREYMSELRDPRLHVAEVGNSRKYVPAGKDTGQRFLEPRDGRQYRYELSDPRLQMAEAMNSGQHMAEVMDSRQHTLERKDVRHHMPEPCNLSIMGRIPSTSVAGSSTHMDTLKSPYTQWNFENLRQRSPDGVVITSRGFSPPRREEELQRRPSVRSYDDIRAGSYMSKDLEFSHPRTCASYMTMTALPAGPAKLMAPPFAPPMPPRSLVQRSSYPVEDQFTVDSFLYSLGLEKYAIHFKAEEVDVHALKQMGESDLKDLGIPMGPRKKILLALQTHARRQI